MKIGGDPKAEAVLREQGNGYLWIVEKCPLCGEEHTHGGGMKGENPDDYLGYRIAHCSGSRSYVLVRKQ